MSRLSLGIAGWVEKTSSKAVPAAAVLLSAVTLAACGESSQDKAKADVCAARNEISKQITKLQGLTLSSNAVNEAKKSFEVIGQELGKIKDAQEDLEPARKEQVEAATKKFEGQLKTISSEVTSGLSPGNLQAALTAAEPKVKSALNTLASGYRQALAPINCS